MAVTVETKSGDAWKKVKTPTTTASATTKTTTKTRGSAMAGRPRTRKVDNKVRKAGVYAGKTAISTGVGTVISHSRRRGKRKRASLLTFVGVIVGGVAEIFGDVSKPHIQMISAAGQGAAAAGLGDAIAERAIEATDELIDDEEEFIDELPEARDDYLEDGTETRRRKIHMQPQTRYSEDQGA